MLLASARPKRPVRQESATRAHDDRGDKTGRLSDARVILVLGFETPSRNRPLGHADYHSMTAKAIFIHPGEAPSWVLVRAQLDWLPSYHTECDEELPPEIEDAFLLGARLREIAHAASRRKGFDGFYRLLNNQITSVFEPAIVARALAAFARFEARSGDVNAALDDIDAILRIRDVLFTRPLHGDLLLSGCVAGGATFRAIPAEIARAVADRRCIVDERRIRELIRRLTDDEPIRSAWRNGAVDMRAWFLSDPTRLEPQFVGSRCRYLPLLDRIALDSAVPRVCAALSEQAETSQRLSLGSNPDLGWPPERARVADRLAREVGDSLCASQLPPKFLFSGIMNDRLSACVLSAALYIREHGVPPITIYDLVPDYLPSIPRDACASDDAEIQMRIVGLRVEFSSVGSTNWLGPYIRTTWDASLDFTGLTETTRH